jgi:repressor of nif and glnA expression
VAGGVESCSDSIHSSDISDVLEVVDVCIREGYQLSKRSKLENWSESGEVAYG